MPEIFNDSNGARVITRHKGPAGKGIPEGGTTGQILVKSSSAAYATTWVNPPDGTGAVVGPSSAINGNFALFDGTTGKLIKDSTFAVSYFATKSYADTKVTIVSGKGLSTNDFTTTLKDKLDLLDPSGYRGSFETIELLEAFDFDTPLPRQGDYCLLELEDAPINLVLWDETNLLWTPVVPDAVDMTGAEIAAVLFDGDDVWDQDTCRIFTEAEKAQLASHETILSTLGLGTIINAYGGVHYFNLTGTTQTLTGTSDGTTNTYKVTVSTALASSSLNFDNGGADNGRLRYTGAVSNVFQITARMALEGASTGDFVVSIAKNGAVVSETRQLTAVNTNNDIENVEVCAILTLLTNEYVEVFIGRTGGTLNPVVHSLAIEAVKIA